MECGISFSGIDGSGKTTQILKMLEFLIKRVLNIGIYLKLSHLKMVLH